VFQSSQFFDLVQILVEVVSHLSLHHQFGSSQGTFFNVDDVLCGVDPLLETLSHHNTVCHVSHSGQFCALAVCGTNSLSFLAIFLCRQSVL
jgi:hypothetical protein